VPEKKPHKNAGSGRRKVKNRKTSKEEYSKQAGGKTINEWLLKRKGSGSML
jgi:hypothetical protein